MIANKQLQGRGVPGESEGKNCLLLGFCAIALRRCGMDGSSTAANTSRTVSSSSRGYKQTPVALLQKVWYH